MFLTFVNALINSSKDLNERITVRNDFYCHNLDAPLTVRPRQFSSTDAITCGGN